MGELAVLHAPVGYRQAGSRSDGNARKTLSAGPGLTLESVEPPGEPYSKPCTAMPSPVSWSLTRSPLSPTPPPRMATRPSLDLRQQYSASVLATRVGTPRIV